MSKKCAKKTPKTERPKNLPTLEAEPIAAIEAKAEQSFFDLSEADKETLLKDQARFGAQRVFSARDVMIEVEPYEESGEKNRLVYSPTHGQDVKEAEAIRAFAGLVGAQNIGFLSAIAPQASNLGSPEQLPDSEGINFVLGVIKGIQPRDQIEAMLGMQMAAIHLASVDRGRRMLVCDDGRRHEYEKAFNRLARTFTAQMEALKKYRSDGKQTVRVERVNVEAGGQAVVGDVHHSGEGGASKNGG